MQGTPIPRDAPTNPILHGMSGPGEPPKLWGRPPTSQPPYGREPQHVQEPAPAPRPRGGTQWPDAAERHHTRSERHEYAEGGGYPERADEVSSTTGPIAARDTSGVQVRLGAREQERWERAERRSRQRAVRRSGLVTAGVLVLAGLVTAGLVLTRGPDGGGPGVVAGDGRPGGADVELPAAGEPIEIGTADGSRYKLATVGSGESNGAVTAFQSTPPSGTTFPYIEYLLSNPTGREILLDFPGDVFVKRDLVTPDARERCMPQAGAPEDMCTPPIKSEVVRHLSGGEPIEGDGGDRYMPPGSTYLVRATVGVPVENGSTDEDMALYVWKQLYMADEVATKAPFPS